MYNILYALRTDAAPAIRSRSARSPSTMNWPLRPVSARKTRGPGSSGPARGRPGQLPSLLQMIHYKCFCARFNLKHIRVLLLTRSPLDFANSDLHILKLLGPRSTCVVMRVPSAFLPVQLRTRRADKQLTRLAVQLRLCCAPALCAVTTWRHGREVCRNWGSLDAYASHCKQQSLKTPAPVFTTPREH